MKPAHAFDMPDGRHVTTFTTADLREYTRAHRIGGSNLAEVLPAAWLASVVDAVLVNLGSKATRLDGEKDYTWTVEIDRQR